VLYEKMICYGDSLTVGARSSVGYPEVVAYLLTQSSGRSWMVCNESVNGDTAVDLLRRIDQNSHSYADAAYASLLIGTNDTKPSVRTEVAEFEMLYEQILWRLQIKHAHVFLFTIPNMWAPVCSPYGSKCGEWIDSYNGVIAHHAELVGLPLIALDGLPKTVFADGVHFNLKGAWKVAAKLATEIMK